MNNNPSIVIGETADSVADLKRLRICIDDDVKKYDALAYTTDLRTIGLIFENMTFRSSALNYKYLNDSCEKERHGVEPFAGNRFITCFSHNVVETEYFWNNYGGEVKENKVRLVFKNFTRDFENMIYTDYCYVTNDKKRLLFGVNNHTDALKKAAKSPDQYAEYELSTRIDVIKIFDPPYVDKGAEEITGQYKLKTSVEFPGKRGSTSMKMNAYESSILGKHKCDCWKKECETRIMSVIESPLKHGKWEFIDLRLKEYIFYELIIVLSPWNNEKLKNQIENIIAKAKLSDKVKNSIKIRDSNLKGKI